MLHGEIEAGIRPITATLTGDEGDADSGNKPNIDIIARICHKSAVPGQRVGGAPAA